MPFEGNLSILASQIYTEMKCGCVVVCYSSSNRNVGKMELEKISDPVALIL